MPVLSVWLVRTALGHLAVGMALGALLLSGRELALGPWLPRLLPLHVELLLFGWTVQLVLGVAYWILPRFRAGRERGSPAPAWAAYWLLNAGVLLAGFGGALGRGFALVLTGRALEMAAAASFAVHAWPRIKAYGADA